MTSRSPRCRGWRGSAWYEAAAAGHRSDAPGRRRGNPHRARMAEDQGMDWTTLRSTARAPRSLRPSRPGHFAEKRIERGGREAAGRLVEDSRRVRAESFLL